MYMVSCITLLVLQWTSFWSLSDLVRISLFNHLTIWEKGRWAVQVFRFLLGSRYGRRPNPTPESNPTPYPLRNPDPKPQPKRARTRHKRGCAAFASKQEISQLRTTIPKCSPRYAFFGSKSSLKIPSPRLLNLPRRNGSYGQRTTLIFSREARA